jgi:hypothetical protein
VLIPNSGGLEDIGWYHHGDPSFKLRVFGTHAYHYAQLMGPAATANSRSPKT